MTIYLPNRNIPRWGVFFVDIFLIIFSIFFAYQLRFNFQIPDSELQLMFMAIPVVLVIRTLTFIIFQTYSGIIYHTSTQDAQRIFWAVSAGSLFFILSNFLFFPFVQAYIFSRAVIIIDYVLTVFLMISFRGFVKILYQQIKQSGKEKKKVIIYGAGEAGLITKRMLSRDIRSKYEVIAFVDDNTAFHKKRIEGVTIYDANRDLERLFVANEINELIIAIVNIELKRKQEIIDLCLQHKVKVLYVPPMSKWINEELSLKQLKEINIEDLLERDPIKLDTEKISSQLKDKVILISGAAGSIGSELVRQILPFHPKKMVLLDQSETALYELELELKENKNIEVVIGDVRNQKRMENVFKTFNPEYVYHAAAYKHVPLMEENPTEAVLTNVLGTEIMSDLAVKYKVKKFVYISTDKAVNPTNVMGASKRIGEIYVQSLNSELSKKENKDHTRFVTTRFGNVLGSNGSVVKLFKKQIEQGGPVTVTDAEVTRYFMIIPEACQLVLEAGAMGEGGEIFIFDMGQSVKINDLAKKMITLSGLELNRDIKIEYIGLRSGEKLKEELLSSQENTLATHHDKIMIAKIREYNFSEIEKSVNELITLFDRQENTQLVAAMKKIVPEFVSQNSVFQELDKVKM